MIKKIEDDSGTLLAGKKHEVIQEATEMVLNEAKRTGASIDSILSTQIIANVIACIGAGKTFEQVQEKTFEQVQEVVSAFLSICRELAIRHLTTETIQ